MDDVVRSAIHAPEAVAVRARSECLRRAGYQEIVEHHSERFGLRDGLDVGHATDLLLTLAGQAIYRKLVVDYYGWPKDTYIVWLSRTLTEALLKAPPSPS